MSLQTLHPLSFDEGIVLDQTPLPGIEIPEDCDYPGLLELMQPIGAEMLMNAIRKRSYLPPHEGIGWSESTDVGARKYKHAPKIQTAHKLLDFITMDSAKIQRMSRAFNSTWAFAAIPTRESELTRQRIIFHGVFGAFSPSTTNVEDIGIVPGVPPGLPYWLHDTRNDTKDGLSRPLLVNTIDGKTVSAAFAQVEGGMKMEATKAALKHGLAGEPRDVSSHSVITFHEHLTAQL